VGELARTLQSVAFPTAPPPAVTGEFRLGDVRHVFADPTRAASALGFSAREDFTQGVAELAAHFVSRGLIGSRDLIGTAT
jgi:dTDP-L-rhamnose 4-epimerase